MEERRRVGPGQLVAAAVTALSVAGFAITVALDVRTPADTVGTAIEPDPGWIYAATGLVLGALSAVLLARHPRDRFGWALAVLGLFWTLDGLAQAYVRIGLTEDAVLPGMNLVLLFLLRFAAFLPVAILVLLLIFPNGHLVEGRWRWVGRVAIALLVSAASLILISPVELPGDVAVPAEIDLGFLAVPAGVIPRGVVRAMVLVAVVAFFVALSLVVVRHRRARGLERDRMRWLLWGVLVMAMSIGVSLLIGSDVLLDVAMFLLMVVPAASMTVAIVHPRVVSIDDLLGGTVVYGALSAGIVAVDLVALRLLTLVLDDGLDRTQLVLVVLLLSAVLYNPLRGVLQQWVRRLVVGDRDDPYGVMTELASRLETADEGPGQLATIAEAVARAFGVGYVSVEVDRGQGERLSATHGTRPAEVRELPITYRGGTVGRLVLPARGLRARLRPRDERLLADLVRQAAAAARATRLAADLQDSRERLVMAREEERRRIRRDLHDGLGPALGGIVFQLETARTMLQKDPSVVGEHLARTRDQVSEVVADVRRLVHGLRPPALDDRGLAGALEQQVGTLRGAGRTADVTIEGVDVPPAAVEVAAYRIVAEALENVSRHADASTCSIRLTGLAGELLVEVTDDGRGIPDDVEVGVGLLSLRERAQEVGGSAEVLARDGGGTIVRARLPMRSLS